ncbi:MAG: hypothetical protein HZB38_03995 [Planctomycetes bacterium]|nr:hypothetical protein [Planctomycetota bacterium]
MKTGLAVVAAVLALSIAIAYGIKQRYGPELAQTQDLVTGLIYFLEQHAGRFPATEQEFTSSAFIEKTGDGGIRVLPQPNTRYRPKTYGIVIRDLARFKVAWGADLTQIHVDERGIGRLPDGREITLVCWPSSPPSAKEYVWLLLDIHKQTQAAASQPASRP